MTTRKSYLERPNYLYLGGGERLSPITSNTLFEFDEADLWSSPNEFVPSEPKRSIPSSLSARKPAKRSDAIDGRPPVAGTSLPVNIPDWSKILLGEYKIRGTKNEDEVDEDGDDDRIPPHEYLARTKIASFSVHEGIGRTLKGRDLSRVRNAIWKQTGFED